MVGWSAGIGAWAQIVGGLFTIHAMLTTYCLVPGAGLHSTGADEMGCELCWLVATLPSLILALFNFASFMEFIALWPGASFRSSLPLCRTRLSQCPAEVEGSILNAAAAGLRPPRSWRLTSSWVSEAWFPYEKNPLLRRHIPLGCRETDTSAFGGHGWDDHRHLSE
jgi:hypothetical protein